MIKSSPGGGGGGGVKLFPLKNLYICTYNLLDRRFLDSPLRAEIVECTHITSARTMYMTVSREPAP